MKGLFQMRTRQLLLKATIAIEWCDPYKISSCGVEIENVRNDSAALS